MDVVGIDISKADFHALLLQGNRPFRRSFPNSKPGYRQLAQWLKNRKAVDVHVCMEATGAYWLGLAMELHDRKIRVSVTNPAQIKSFARTQLRRTKTDSVDAAIIADFCQKLTPSLWIPPQREILQIRALITYRDQLVGDRVRARQLVSTVQGSEILAAHSKRQIEDLTKLIKSIEVDLRKLIADTPNIATAIALLETIPGIATLSAAAILAHLPMERLRNSKAAAAYAGLTPCHRQSGTSVNGRPRLSKIGNARLRRAVYMPATSVMRGNSSIAAFGNRLLAAGKCNKVAKAAVMRKLITIAYGVLKRGQAFDPAYKLDSQHGI